MNISCIGGGPASCFFSIIMKKALPDTNITVYERHESDIRLGWGVVIPDSLLRVIKRNDEDLHNKVVSICASWRSIHILRDSRLSIIPNQPGNAINRHEFINLLSNKAESLGIQIMRNTTIEMEDAISPADLIVWADGSGNRSKNRILTADQMSAKESANKFIWLGLEREYEEMGFIFKTTPYGLIWAHVYPIGSQLSTFVVECSEATFTQFKFNEMDIETTITILSEIFADVCQQKRLQYLSAAHQWRTFKQLYTTHLYKANQVLLGDAAHTAHFSLGSGTRIAMEDAELLARTLIDDANIPSALTTFSKKRTASVLQVQTPALKSMNWFNDVAQHYLLDDTGFEKALMFRSA